MLPLTPVTRAYEWGSPTAIPDYLGCPAPGGPVAELWYGAHPLGPSPVNKPGWEGQTLLNAIDRDPVGTLGAASGAGCLPYLLKLLGVAKPLSLQVHPSGEAARLGFRREQAEGLPIDSPLRNYRDSNHKPELVLALTSFEALAGFREVDEVRADLTGVDARLARRMLRLLDGPDPIRACLEGLFRTEPATPAEVVGLAQACADAAKTATAAAPALRLVGRLAAAYPGDGGVAVALLLRPVHLAPGETLYVPDSTIHCYLRGVGLEIQAASDNVLRAGLTVKHLAVDELLAQVRTSYGPGPHVDAVSAEPGQRWTPPVPDFELWHLPVSAARPVPGNGPRLVLGLRGELRVATTAEAIDITPGQAVFLRADEVGAVLAGSGVAAVAGTRCGVTV
jgi:mannose-6-phosphate isomerase